MWSTAFNNDVFSAGLKATSRSESTNHVLNGLGDLSTYLHIFVTNYEKNVVNKWCLSEEHEDFKCKQGKPTPVVKGSPILTQISAVYTHKIYNIFEKEFLKGAGTCFIEAKVYCDGHVSKYEVKMHNSSKSWFVELDHTTLHVTCTCKKFESMGILCAHCLLIYTSNKVCEIPKEYILRRWTKDARKRIKNLPSQSCSMNRSSESEIVYTNSMMQTCYNLTHLSKYSVECREIFQRHLENVSDELDDYLEKLNSSAAHISAKNCEKNIEDNKVLEPLYVKVPGVRKERILRHWEKPKQRKTFQLTNGKIKKSQKDVAPSIKNMFEDNAYTPHQAISPLPEVNLQDVDFDLDMNESNVSLLAWLQSVGNTT
uniref:Protein FAR1-RELATED SEQUENCE n=1 Tax=Nicotiana sylvestris TaxID=4096 RepID=A0A1U7WY26_NICSY|nr:PREDICTED: protein FAR1-RELATED SEQUENCE 9-like [Nicotiana sylvestris]